MDAPEFTDLDKEFHYYYVLFILCEHKQPCPNEDFERLYSALRNPRCIHGRLRKGCYQCQPPISAWSTGYPK